MKSGSVLLQLLGGTKSSHALRRWINLWPPFLGAGIRVKRIAQDMKAVDVEMKLRGLRISMNGISSTVAPSLRSPPESALA